MYFDRSYTLKGAGASVVLIPPESDALKYAIQVAKQVQEYDCNSDMMVGYLAEVHRMEQFFDGFEVRYVLRLDNRDADHLAWVASSRALTPPDVIVERLSKHLVKSEESTSEVGPELMVIVEPAQQLAYNWMSPIRAYLDN
jgi:hypothetical protein